MGKARKTKKRKLVFDKEGVEKFALRFTEIRKREGYTQEQLAFESGISRIQIARIETARINPTISTIFTIARAMGIDTDEFFKFRL
ncbi:MAG: helix-turn-helix transcriptional regulator [Bacteroidetes bacterium]|nr:helix-turn-helix transcriptional regulator [Bacteroidota bacterium]